MLAWRFSGKLEYDERLGRADERSATTVNSAELSSCRFTGARLRHCLAHSWEILEFIINQLQRYDAKRLIQRRYLVMPTTPRTKA